jgi:putative FmdB family regulatory protein
MPIREYQCEECGAEWEELRRDQTDPEECPDCGTPDCLHRKLPTGTGFDFKTRGFSGTT